MVSYNKRRKPTPKDDSDNMDWAMEYQAFLEEKEKLNANESDEDEKIKEQDTTVEGEDWAKEYAAYCGEKEKEFFDANKVE